MTCVHYASIASSAIIEASHSVLNMRIIILTVLSKLAAVPSLLQHWKHHQINPGGFPFCHEHHPKLTSSVTHHVILLAVTPETVFSHELEIPGMGITAVTRHVLDQDVFQTARALPCNIPCIFLVFGARRARSRCLRTCHNAFERQLVVLCHWWYGIPSLHMSFFLAPPIVGSCGSHLANACRLDLLFVCCESDAVLQRMLAV
jgi:hypothetical protein